MKTFSRRIFLFAVVLGGLRLAAQAQTYDNSAFLAQGGAFAAKGIAIYTSPFGDELVDLANRENVSEVTSKPWNSGGFGGPHAAYKVDFSNASKASSVPKGGWTLVLLGLSCLARACVSRPYDNSAIGADIDFLDTRATTTYGHTFTAATNPVLDDWSFLAGFRGRRKRKLVYRHGYSIPNEEHSIND